MTSTLLRAAGMLGFCVLGLARQSGGQTTDVLGTYSRDFQYQFSVGGGPGAKPDYGEKLGPLIAMEVSAQWRLQGAMRLRIDAWMLDRRPTDFAGAAYAQQLVTSRSFAALVSGEFPMRLSRTITVGPILGIGFVPYMHGLLRQYGGPNEPSNDIPLTATGEVFSAGLALRWRGLVVEQFLHVISGVQSPLSDATTSPLMIGWRF